MMNCKVSITNIREFGFELLNDKKQKIIETIKNRIIKLVYDEDFTLRNNLSSILSEALHQDYSSISKLFSEVEGTTIEKYLIAIKIERVKELLMYDELSLSEIAHKMNYSSVAYLSSQFKKTTGLSPTFFKQLKENKRKSIDQL